MSYKKFSECGKPIRCNLMGDLIVMNPLMMGLEFKNKYRIPYNGMRILPPALTNNIDYSNITKAYPQEKIQ